LTFGPDFCLFSATKGSSSIGRPVAGLEPCEPPFWDLGFGIFVRIVGGSHLMVDGIR